MTTREITVGTEVMSRDGNYIYDGPGDGGPFSRIKFDMRNGGLPKIETDPALLAPIEVEEKVNLKDPRIQIIKHPKKPYAWVSGPWEARAEGDDGSTWHKTKKDGVEEIARKLAIRDWHAEEVVSVVDE